MGEKEKPASGAPPNGDSLPALVGRLGDNILTLLDTKFTLLKIELQEDVNAYLRGGLSIGIGGILVIVGFALLNIALAFFVATLFASTDLSQPVKYALGFILTGALYLVIGAVVIIRAKNRLAKQPLGPEKSMEEIEKDRQWLKREL